MKAFLTAMVLMLAIGVLAWAGLDTLPMAADEVFVSPRGSVRL